MTCQTIQCQMYMKINTMVEYIEFAMTNWTNLDHSQGVENRVMSERLQENCI